MQSLKKYTKSKENKMKDFVKNMVLEATQYTSGYINKDDDYVISASMVGKEPLQNYLSIVHGKVADTEIGDNTLGSVFHEGMEQIATRKYIDDIGETGRSNIWGIEKSLHHKLSNGWVLSGTADLILIDEESNIEVHDYKLTKSYAHAMFLKEKFSHDYTKQLQVLDALMREGEDRPQSINGTTSLIIDYFVKDAKAINYETSHRPEPAPPKIGTSDIRPAEATLLEVVAITDSLQGYIEAGQVPPECKDKWPRNVKGTVVNTKCALYCSHGKASLCPYYNPTTREAVNKLANW